MDSRNFVYEVAYECPNIMSLHGYYVGTICDKGVVRYQNSQPGMQWYVYTVFYNDWSASSVLILISFIFIMGTLNMGHSTLLCVLTAQMATSCKCPNKFFIYFSEYLVYKNISGMNCSQ
jgi:hypothetical protein